MLSTDETLTTIRVRWVSRRARARSSAVGASSASSVTSGVAGPWLMESPNLKHVGPAKVGGEETQHYKGTLSLKE
ncbi:hypothetical protein ACWEP3_24815, partial [Streptomyces albidoflavus]